jgi:hypothetical protein
MKRRCLFTLAVYLGCLQCATSAFPQNDDHVLTLHAYANLVQIPVLVLSSRMQRLPNLDAQQFVVRLNSGPTFHPTHVRLEGDDPLSLGVLMDVQGSKAGRLRALGEGLASLVPESLHPVDRVALYAAGCDIVHGSVSQPVGSQLRTLMDEVMQVVDPQESSGCKDPDHLWNAMAYLSQKLATLPGRRVLLVVTDDAHPVKQELWVKLRDYANSEGVTIFALSAGSTELYRAGEFEPLNAICELSGGLRMWSSDKSLPGALKGLVAMLRERYIIDFPRPNNIDPGKIVIEVSLAERSAFIRPAGLGVPIPDPKILADPSTVPGDPSEGTPIGKRGVLPH